MKRFRMHKSIVKQGINYAIRAIKKGAIIGGISLYAFCLGEFVLSTGSHLLSEQITNQKQLERILKEEMSKLGIKDKEISARFGESRFGLGSSYKFADGSYGIVLDFGKNRANVIHELYHIYDGHHEDRETISNVILANLKYFFIYEPQAILYGALDIKL